MNIAILSFRYPDQAFSPEEIRLKQAGEKLGHETEIYHVDDCQLVCGVDGLEVFYGDKPFPKTDVMIPRAGVVNNVEFQAAIIKQFQLMGVPLINNYLAITRAKNKLRTTQILAKAGIAVPKTIAIRSQRYLDAVSPKQVIIRSQADILQAVKILGGFPVILKVPFGSFGSGVVLVESEAGVKSVWTFMSTVLLDNVILVQEYIKEANGEDIRVFVVGERAIAAMKRKATTGDFRSNLELGGQSQAFTLTPEISDLAVRATKALGLQVAGLDIIMTKNGPAIIEVNANAGFKGLEEATGVDVAGEIIRYAESLKFKT